MKSCIVIPARLQSSRLPEKVLLPIGDKPMIQVVYEQALKVENIHKIIIATDHAKIFDVCQSFGAYVMMTSASHVSGTDRIGEVAAKYKEFDFFINIQGDEPLVDARMLTEFNLFLQSSKFDICTVCEKMSNEQDLFDYNCVKLVKTYNQKVLYFSRNAIPAFRDKAYKDWLLHHQYFRHIGIYGFSKSAIENIAKLPVSKLESAESLEQLRWLEHDYSIGVMESESYSIGVDTQEDLDRVRSLIQSK